MLACENTANKKIPEFRFATSGMTLIAGDTVIPANAGIYIQNCNWKIINNKF